MAVEPGRIPALFGEDQFKLADGRGMIFPGPGQFRYPRCQRRPGTGFIAQQQQGLRPGRRAPIGIFALRRVPIEQCQRVLCQHDRPSRLAAQKRQRRGIDQRITVPLQLSRSRISLRRQPVKPHPLCPIGNLGLILEQTPLQGQRLRIIRPRIPARRMKQCPGPRRIPGTGEGEDLGERGHASINTGLADAAANRAGVQFLRQPPTCVCRQHGCRKRCASLYL